MLGKTTQKKKLKNYTRNIPQQPFFGAYMCKNQDQALFYTGELSALRHIRQADAASSASGFLRAADVADFEDTTAERERKDGEAKNADIPELVQFCEETDFPDCFSFC